MGNKGHILSFCLLKSVIFRKHGNILYIDTPVLGAEWWTQTNVSLIQLCDSQYSDPNNKLFAVSQGNTKTRRVLLHSVNTLNWVVHAAAWSYQYKKGENDNRTLQKKGISLTHESTNLFSTHTAITNVCKREKVVKCSDLSGSMRRPNTGTCCCCSGSIIMLKMGPIADLVQ